MLHSYGRNRVSAYDFHVHKAHDERARAIGIMTSRTREALVATGWKLWRGLANSTRAFARQLGDSYRFRMAIRELQALDDRTLHDIGLPRSEIASRVRSLHDCGRDHIERTKAGCEIIQLPSARAAAGSAATRPGSPRRVA